MNAGRPDIVTVDNLVAVLDQISEGVFVTDRALQVAYWNYAAEAITGYTKEEVLGRRCDSSFLEHTDLSGNTVCNTHLFPLYRAIYLGESNKQPVSLTICGKNGKKVSVEVSALPLLDREGERVGGVELFREIGEELVLEEQKARFFSAISHELKTPLANMQGFLELLISGDAGPLNDEQKEFAGIVYNQEQKLAAVIEEVLNMAQFESRELSYDRSITDLSNLLTGLARQFGPEAQEKELHFRADIKPGLRVLGDKKRLEQAVGHLLGNAVKYTESGFIELSANFTDKSKEVIISVVDSGIGIAPEEQESIFEMFHRLENPGTRKAGGAGVGLYVVKRIIERHNGKVRLTSSPGRGSRFELALPGVMITS